MLKRTLITLLSLWALFLSDPGLCVKKYPKSFKEQDPYTIGSNGLEFYEEGDYKKASQHLSYALENKQHTFALTYADICRRNLDEGNHSLAEAAEWYVTAADAHDGDALSYLGSLDSTFLDDKKTFKDKVRTLKKIWRIEDREEDANAGFVLYTENKFKEAAPLLKKASKANHPYAQQFYADICFRQLDDEPHSYLEAAQWYLFSGLGGDGQSASFLNSIVPTILQIQDHWKQMGLIVAYWMKQEATHKGLRPLKPREVNDYLIYQYDLEINITQAQKLPFFLDEVVSALLYKYLAVSFSSIEEVVSPDFSNAGDQKSPGSQNADEKKSSSSSAEEPMDLEIEEEDFEEVALPDSQPVQENDVKSDSPIPSFARTPCVQQYLASLPKLISQQATPCIYGPIYRDYLKNDLKGYKSKEKLKKPDQRPNIHPFWGLLLDSYAVIIKDKAAGDLTQLSHREHPWLLASIKLWKKIYPSQEFDKTSLSEAALIRKLEACEALDEGDTKLILDEIESKIQKKWPNTKEEHISTGFASISTAFSKHVRYYFLSDVSRESELCKAFEQDFFSRIKSHDLDCKESRSLDVLRTPFLMYYCVKLTLRNIASHPLTSGNALIEAYRYFFHLKEFTISYEVSFNPQHKMGQKIKRIIKNIKRREIEIIEK